MSDRNERECRNCGSYLHHEDECPKEKRDESPSPPATDGGGKDKQRCTKELFIEKYFGYKLTETPRVIHTDDHILTDMLYAWDQQNSPPKHDFFMCGGNTEDEKAFYTLGYRAALTSQPCEPGVEWVSVEDRPLFTIDEKGRWTCTEDGDKEFIAAVAFRNNKTGKDGWWIHHCVIQDETGLCVVGEDDNEPAGYSMEDVTHYIPLPAPPNFSNQPNQSK